MSRINNAMILEAAELSPQAAEWSRTFDYLIMIVGAFLVWSVTYISQLLLAGDWDFFIDWKDRQYWVLITPSVTIMMAAGFQAIFWKLFRLPLGATASLLLFLIGVWIVRYQSWMGLAYFPLSLVIPGTCLMSAIALDCILLLSRSWLVTGFGGAVLYGILFFPSNWIYIAPYHMPVEHMGTMTSLADLIGYVYPRSGTPEYIRIIERGTLRTFSDSAIWVSAFFSGFICVFAYYIFWGIGSLACTIKFYAVGDRFKGVYGHKPAVAGETA
jgi:methane/ammonia monooxygenase subunit A